MNDMVTRRSGSQVPRLLLTVGASLLGAASALAQSTPQSAEPAASTLSSVQRLDALKATLSPAATLDPQTLGSNANDLVYTPVTPCRIVDSRLAQGPLSANVTRQYDVDNQTSFSSQGGFNGTCGVPYGKAYAVALTITAVGPSNAGNFTAYGYSGPRPNSSTLNFVAGQTVASTTIVPDLPGAGNDFSIVSTVNSNVVIDVVGYFAAPVATALNCTNVASAVTSIPYNVYTAVDAICPAGYTVTGGGTYPIDGTLGRPNVWTDGSPTASGGNGWRTYFDNQTGSARSGQTYARCCQIPGR